ncbi:MAG: fibronectin type III domain-containing protein [Melioribacteraceae bacterium]|nr:fibronectin type III domain-containing protein [Melioribacteraceae bacterium]
MKKLWFLLICVLLVQHTYAQSTITISPGTSISIGSGSTVTSGYRDGTLSGGGYFNSLTILFDPTATAATSVTQSSFSANWNTSGSVGVASGYKLDVSTDINFGTFVSGYQNLDIGNFLSYSVNSNITAGTTYYYRVRAYDLNGITGYSNTITLVTAPPAPVASAATSINQSSFTANWSASATANKYFIDVATDAAFTNKLANWDNKDIGNVTSYSVASDLNASTTYYYRVRAANNYGVSVSSNTITVLTAPLPPSAQAASLISQSAFSANWDASVSATKYFLDVATTSNFSAGTFITGYQNLDVGGVLTYPVSSNINSGITYYYRIRSNNSNGTSTNSNVITVSTIPPNPTALTATSITQSSFIAKWNRSTGATNYFIDVSANAGFTSFVTDWENVSIGNDTLKSINTNLAGGTTYYYRVRSENSGGISGNSNSISALTIPPDPVATAASSVTQTSFDANWNLSLSATKYFLDVATDNGFTNLVTGWNNVDVGDVATYSVNSNLSSGTRYYYRVRALNANGTSGNSNTINEILIPPDPVATAAANIGQTSFSANWNAANGASKYFIDVATDNLFEHPVAGWSDLDVGDVLTKTVNSNLTPGTNYYYRVRAFNTSGLSGNSNIISLITAPIAPVATAGTNSATGSFSANWNVTATATGYLLDVSTDAGFGAGTFVTGYNGRDVGDVLTFSVSSNLNSGSTYYYRVRAYNAGGTGTNSNTITYGTKPVSPIASAPTLITSTSFSANWNSTPGAIGYRLDVSTASDFSSFVDFYNDRNVDNVLTFSVTGLNSNTTYYYRVRAYNDYGTGSSSSYITTLTAPAAPVSDAASGIATTEFSANWQTSAGATGYFLDLSTASNFSTFISGFNGKDVGNVTSYLVSGLLSGTTYYYRLRGYNSGGASPNSNDQTVLTLSSPPVALTATGITATAFDANWTASTAATGYKLDVSTDPLFGALNFVGLFNDKDVGNVLTQNVTGLTAGTTYYYQIRSYNGSGTDGNSSVITVTTIPPAPAEQAATSITSNSFFANWNASTGANGYYLDVATDGGFGGGAFVSGYQNLDVGNVTTYSITGLNAGTQYYYRVRGYNLAGTSSNSGTASPVTSAGIPKPPASSPASAVAATSFNANWVASAGATSYRIDVSTHSNFSDFVTDWDNAVLGNVTTISVNANINSGTTYYYRVRAVNGSETSDNSSIITVTTIPPAPVEAAASEVTNNGFKANWNTSTGTSGYRLEVSTANDFSSFVAGYQNLDAGNTTSYTVNGLIGGTTYYYRIKAYNTGGTSGVSGTTTQATDADPEGTVNATSVSNIISTGFDANWNAFGGATGYKIDVSTVDDFATYVGIYNNLDVANVITYPVAGLSGGTTYYYRIKAYDAVEQKGISGNVTVITIPAAPTPNAATSIGELNFTANWNSSTGATGYYLDVATDNGFTSFISGFNNKYVNNVTTYTVTGLSGGTNYYYRIKAKNGSGNSSVSVTESVITIPTEPGVLSASLIQSTSFTANWNTATGATGYRLDVSTVSDFSSRLGSYDNLDVLNVTSKSVTGLNSGTTYYYRLRAYNGNGISDYSLFITVTTAPAAPVSNAASSITQNSFIANWDASTGSAKYFIDVATTSGFTGNYITGFENRDIGNVTSYSISGLSGGSNYYYRVRAYNANGTSTNSGTISVLTIPPDPVVLSATGVQTTSFNANWNFSTGASKYYIDVATDVEFTSMVNNWNNVDVGNVSNKSVNTDLTTNTRYYYRVRAFNATGISGNSGISTVTTGPAAPVATAATSPEETNFQANWNSSAGADGYRIDVSTDSGFPDFVSGFNNKDIGNVLTYPITGLSGGTTYYYRISAYVGGRSSDPSNTISSLTKPPSPISTAATSVSSTQFSANWNSSTSATKYYLEVSTVSDFSSYVAGFNLEDVGDVLTFSVTGLSANTIHYYRVSANNGSGTGAVSNIITVLTAPAAPTANAASSITNVSFNANWTASPGATGYFLDVATDAGFSNRLVDYNNKDVGNVITSSVTDLSGSTQYHYRVRAYNSGGTSGNSGTQSPTTLVNPSGVPVASAATDFIETSFKANWGTVADAAGYKLDVATNITFTNYVSGFQNLDVGNVIEKSVIGLTGGTNYYYRIRSYNISGTSSNSGTITALTIPASPVSTSSSLLAETSFSANWNSVTGATKYLLDVSTDAAFGSGNFVAGFQDKDVSNVVTFSVTGLTGGINYYFRVRAFNTSGTSGNSGTQTALTIPAPPVATSATTISQTGFTANWNSSTGSTKYFLDVATDAAFGAGTFVTGYQNKDMDNVLTHLLSGLSVNTSYYYRVRAQNTSGTSGNSNVITAIGIPSATSASSVTASSFSANWNIVSGATDYRIDVSADSNFASFVTDWQNVSMAGGAVATKLVNTNLAPYTIYYYRIRSFDGSVTSVNSNRINLTTAPLAPTATAATSISQNSFIANWNVPVGGALGYRIDISTDAAFGPGNFVAGYEDLNVQNVTTDTIDSNILSGTNYYYRVRGYSANASGANSNTITLITKMATPETGPPTNVTQTSFDANWDFSTGATKYFLDVSTDFGFTSILAGYNNIDVGNVNTYPVTGLTANTNYYYRLRAFNPSETTANSSSSHVITNSLPPVANPATLVTHSGFQANWTPQGSASAGYKLDVAKEAAFINFLSGYEDLGIAGSTTTNVIANMTEGIPYFYRVRAYSPFGSSANSNIICAAKQPTDLKFININSTSFAVSFKPSKSGGKYLVVRGTGVAPVFEPTDGNNYSVGDQGADKIVYVGADTTFNETSISTSTTLHYKIYSNQISGGVNYYILDSPLSGSNQLFAGDNPTGVVQPTATPTSALFPDVGVAVSFTNGTAGTTLTASKETTQPASGIGLSGSGVNRLEPLYFSIQSTNPAPGVYDIVLDFSSLNYPDWSKYKVLKRIDDNSNWQDITLPPINAVILNRATDGVPGKFTISGLTNFSQFVLGSFVNQQVQQRINLLSPQAGDKWKAGTTQTIVWQTTGNIPGVLLEYSTDDGIKWNHILDQILVAIPYYNWMVPSGINSDKCKIRISNWYSMSVNAMTVGTFSILDPNLPLQKQGDIDNDSNVTANDASLVLQYIVGMITFNDAQKKAADVDSDGTITTNDATKILYYVVNGNWQLSKVSSVSGKIIFDRIYHNSEGEIVIPINSVNLAGATSVFISFDFRGQKIDSISYQSLLKDNWLVVSNTSDQKFMVAIAGISELTPGTIGLIKTGVKDFIYDSIINVTCIINGTVSQMDEINFIDFLPKDFSLKQNYPNPFNPVTTIEFSIPRNGRYSITVYNILGQLIKTLAESEYEPGYYKLNFDASGLASGVYIYRLSGLKVNILKKMIILK